MTLQHLFSEGLMLCGKPCGLDDIINQPIVALYFTASYCPPCRIFTPQLVEFQSQYNIPVIVIGRDKTQQAYDEYMLEQPNHYYVDYNLIQRRNELADKFNIVTIPKLIILDKQQNVVTSNGRVEIQENSKLAITKWRYITQ